MCAAKCAYRVAIEAVVTIVEPMEQSRLVPSRGEASIEKYLMLAEALHLLLV